MEIYEHGSHKYPGASVAVSSVSCGWSRIVAEVRDHRACILDPMLIEHTEVAIATSEAHATIVHRRGNGELQHTAALPGTIWLCPVGVYEEDVIMTGPLQLLHLYVPEQRFVELSTLRGGQAFAAESVRYLADVHDDLIFQIGQSLLRELYAPTSAGRVLAESLALPLTARLAQAYGDASASVESVHMLDEPRLQRVLEYMSANLDAHVSIDDLAAVAHLSAFHFIRMFRKRTGQPPHRYLGQLRLERAKAMLMNGRESLIEISQASCFTSQANFTRAFRRATGTTPGAFRRSSRAHD